jgi:beta-glucosidase
LLDPARPAQPSAGIDDTGVELDCVEGAHGRCFLEVLMAVAGCVPAPAVGYKWYDSQGIAPLFPFGFGLSYTVYSYNGGLSVTPSTNGNRPLKVNFRVTNFGTTAGTQTSQVYLTLPSSTGEPGKRLVGFVQTTLKPRQSQRVQVTIDPRSADLPLSYYDTTSHTWTIAPGAYTVQVGGSSRDLPVSATFQVR